MIDDPELLRVFGVGGISFFDAEGFRFHLPAYLSLAVIDFLTYIQKSDVLTDLLIHLTSMLEENRERFAILNAAQRACIRDVLVFLNEEYYEYIGASEIDEAIKGYWSS